MTNKLERLKELIASYWELDGDRINWDVEFSSRGLRNFSSLRALRFLASVEADLGISIEDPDLVKILRDLLSLVEE